MNLDADTLGTEQVKAYRQMLTIRKFEERALELRHTNQIAGSVHPCGGQEAVPTGALAALLDGDRVIATYRGHGWAIACGVPLLSLFGELLGRACGTNGGRAGSAYLSAPEYGFLGENSIVGAGLPIANGVALASVLSGAERVVAVSFGDGATSQGAAHEGLVMAVTKRLPVVFICENNDWSEMTPIKSISPLPDLAERASAYGMPGVTVDGNDPQAVAAAVREAATRGRQGGGPTFLECKTVRLMAHYHADFEHYRSKDDLAAARDRDPLPRLRQRLVEELGVDEQSVAAVEEAADDIVRVAEQEALKSPLADASTAAQHVVALPLGLPQVAERGGETKRMTVAGALNAALARELSDNPEVVVFGEDVAIPGGVFGVTRRLQRDFGQDRVFDTPIAEAAILGAALGAAQEGLKPVVEIMYSDFLLVALDQLVNQAANVRYLHSGRRSAPMVVRCQQGATPGSCAQHSQSVEALLAHIPGLKIGMASNAGDAYAMLRAAIHDPDPVVVIENRILYQNEGEVLVNGPIEIVGGAAPCAEGSDAIVVSWGATVIKAQEAAAVLRREGISVGVLDLRWLNPLDRDVLLEQTRAVGRVLVAHEANVTCGFGAEIAALVQEHAYSDLVAPVRRVGTPDSRIPASPALQAALIPSAEKIAEALRSLIQATVRRAAVPG